jgi:hypothetical protein
MVLEPDWKLFTEEKEAINLEMMDIVESLGMGIAFPSRTLYIENFPPLPTDHPPQPLQPGQTNETDVKG